MLKRVALMVAGALALGVVVAVPAEAAGAPGCWYGWDAGRLVRVCPDGVKPLNKFKRWPGHRLVLPKPPKPGLH